MKALLAPGLPGIVAPKTAGQILANVLSQLLRADGIAKEEIKNEFKWKTNWFWINRFPLHV